jgi:hypothetical protein
MMYAFETADVWRDRQITRLPQKKTTDCKPASIRITIVLTVE